MKLSQKLTKEQTDPFFEEWRAKAAIISDLHKQRDKQAKDEMEAGILLYNKLLAHCLETGAIPGVKVLAPINGEERLAFVASQPGNFAAFRQLDELFAEMKKIIAAKRIHLKRFEQD
ncbi:hypothetical protein B0H99_101193 [Planomicrobium soli]|uniref:YpoC-like domain-containing protein n=1 Tax=Planomicrobium soli TaxID=1176648 RepID=A0A2P8H6U4_9BACL|nr:hypothetical protein [Planomicrobium soli]PSL41946.1 hypothetical protein B0H99_101193 [Planomicrobium soli]